MATMTVTIQSKELSRKVTFSAIIPTATKSLYDPNGVGKLSETSLETLYLLHGWDGNHEDWLHNTRIVELATKYQIAVVMPAGENGFYVDHPNRNNYGKFISKELIEETRHLFPLSTKREETWISGLSMGGYGALRNGLLYNETFGKVAAFSSRIFTKNDTYHNLGEENTINYRTRAVIESDSFEDLPESMDLYHLAMSTERAPEIFLACGTEDFLYKENEAYHNYLLEKDIPHVYHEAAGTHNWDFWNHYIEEAIKWLKNN